MTKHALCSTFAATLLAGALLFPARAPAQAAVSSASAPVAGSIAAPGAETVVCTGQANVNVTTVTDPTIQPLALVSVDTSGVSCTGALSRARYVNTGVPTLTRPLGARDVVETTLAVQQDAPDGHLRARPALLTLNLVYDPVSGALLAVTGTLGSPR
ncbi:MAG TPA: hypothetical protein VFP65_26950 [Anaeromyxobacteraceae bacterium]|nr:hypothetical protein [Anaeromyxobacteraceae bacterium]